MARERPTSANRARPTWNHFRDERSSKRRPLRRHRLKPRVGKNFVGLGSSPNACGQFLRGLPELCGAITVRRHGGRLNGPFRGNVVSHRLAHEPPVPRPSAWTIQVLQLPMKPGERGNLLRRAWSGSVPDPLKLCSNSTRRLRIVHSASSRIALYQRLPGENRARIGLPRARKPNGYSDHLAQEDDTDREKITLGSSAAYRCSWAESAASWHEETLRRG